MEDGNQPVESGSSTVTPAKVEMTQAELNELVASSKKASYEKGRKEAAELLSQSNPSLSEERVNELVAEQVKKAHESAAQAQREQMIQEKANKSINQFFSKIQAGKERYPDIEKEIAELGLEESIEIIELVNDVDNTADVMHELAKNPGKAASVVAALRTGQTKNARSQIQRLSNSIRDNQKSTVVVPKEPLSQIKSSNIAGDDGLPSLESLKKASYLRR